MAQVARHSEDAAAGDLRRSASGHPRTSPGDVAPPRDHDRGPRHTDDGPRRHRHGRHQGPPPQGMTPFADGGIPSPRGGETRITSLQRRRSIGRGRHATSYGENFGHLMSWTVVGSLLPGSGLLAAGRRVSGMTAVFLGSLLVSLAATFVLVGDPIGLLQSMASRPDRFVMLAAGLGLVALLWAAMVIGTHAALRRYAHLSGLQRLLSTTMVLTLVALVALPTAKVASYSVIMRDTLTGIFSAGVSTFSGAGPDSSKTDPWANTSRINVLLIGSDAGADRIGIRPDTLILASIDTQSGDTILFSLPRNLEKVPFPPGTPQAAEYPNGFDCVDADGVPQCLLNAFWTFGEEHWQDYYRDEPDAFHAGLRATSEAVEQVTGLPVDQYAMLNLRGFTQFVNAVGGITVNVSERLPIGGSSENRVASGWIEPGDNQHLDGYHALWYARSRWSTDDYDRMRRQRCVIAAVVEQADPATVALAFPQIAAAAKNNITTGIPLSDLSAWVELTMRVKGATVRSLPFTSNVINPEDPDIAEMRRLVADAVTAEPEPSPTATPSPPATAGSGSSQSPSPADSADATPEESTTAQNVADVC